MRLPRRKRPAEPPQGVRITRADGSVIECDVLRDPDQDRDGCACWVVVPRTDPGFFTRTDHLSCDVLPPRTSLVVEVRARIDLDGPSPN